MKKIKHHALLLFIITLTILSSCKSQKGVVVQQDPNHPKREFRGAWIHTVGQMQYQKMSNDEMKEYFVKMLNDLQKAGINAIVFQVRPQADAFYNSQLEPWSRYLTGTQGKAPADGFDPLAFLTKECHQRNMELHAWLNPYRVGNTDQDYTPEHLYRQQPERFITYGKQIYFDPGIPENRAFICKVVQDITLHYDIDAIHMDDYFYPYPIVGEDFPDNKSFNQYAKSQGFAEDQRGDWRRNNVNMLIREIKQTLTFTKPWVRFGVSPFGIYRNKKSTPDGSGSETNGLQNYDDLFADIKLWVEKGWVDYNVPQLYWEMGHKAADYSTLLDWWAANNFKQPLYIGQSVNRTMDAPSATAPTQLDDKMKSTRAVPTIHGNCFWPGYALVKNYKNATDELTNNYHKYPALIPAYTHMNTSVPKAVKNIKEHFSQDHHFLEWEANSEANNPESAKYFVVYRFAEGEKENLNSAKNIVSIVRNNQCLLPYEGGNKKYKYVITAVDAFHNESKGKSKKVVI